MSYERRYIPNWNISNISTHWDTKTTNRKVGIMSETKDALREAREAWKNREKTEEEEHKQYVSKLEALLKTNKHLKMQNEMLEGQLEEQLGILEDCHSKRRELEDTNHSLVKQITNLLDENQKKPKEVIVRKPTTPLWTVLLSVALMLGLLFTFVDTTNYIEQHHKVHQIQYDDTKILTAECLSLNRKTISLLTEQNRVLNECNKFKRHRR